MNLTLLDAAVTLMVTAAAFFVIVVVAGAFADIRVARHTGRDPLLERRRRASTVTTTAGAAETFDPTLPVDVDHPGPPTATDTWTGRR